MAIVRRFILSDASYIYTRLKGWPEQKIDISQKRKT